MLQLHYMSRLSGPFATNVPWWGYGGGADEIPLQAIDTGLGKELGILGALNAFGDGEHVKVLSD